MSANRAQPLILVIGSRDEFLHVYQDGKELLAVNTIGTDPGEHPSPIEFFDSDGYRLAGIYNRQWQLVKLIPATGKPDLPVLLQRVRNALNNLQALIESNSDFEESEEFRTALKDALLQLSGVRTSAGLREYLQNFFSRPVTGNDRIDDSAPAFGANGNPIHQGMKRAWGH